jgi:aldose sugar dehydrogenase
MRTHLLVCAALVTAVSAHAQTFPSSAGPLRVVTFARGLVNPWGLAFLPDGRLLVTERPGRMRIIGKDGTLSPPLVGLPQVYASGQSGLLDVALDRDFLANRTLYFCYSATRGGAAAVARARLADGEAPRLDAVRTIFIQSGPAGGANLGCRIVQDRDGNLFVTLGDHFTPRDEAQNLANHIGKIVRIAPDGGVPPDNPFVGNPAARAEIWVYGVRNPQGLAINPADGKLWEHEHGPRGGDEVNIIAKGKNYGWPVIGYGIDYNGAKIHQATHKDGMEQPLHDWGPSIAPSGMAFYTGNLFAVWKGDLFIGALKARVLVRLALDGDKVVQEERLLHELGERIRDVRDGPDGALWLLTDSPDGRVLRVTPAAR